MATKAFFKIAMNDDPAFLSVGTDVSAKYKGAFCEAKIKKVVKNIKCKVTLKSGGGGTLVVPDDAIKGTLRVGNTVEVRNEAKKETAEAILTKIQDCSQYTVVFDDGDITTLRRSALCLKSGRHFADGETLDQLPLTHPEHFSSPVIGHSAGRRGRRAQRSQSEERRAWEGEGWVREREPHAGRVVLVEAAGGPQERRRPQPPWFPGLVVAPTAQDTVKIRIQDDYLVRSFKDGRYYTVPKKEAREFKKGSGPQDVAGIEAALQYLNAGVLPPHWDRDVLFGTDQIGKNDDGNSDDSSDDEPREEKDHFVAQLYKFMDDRGTPLNRQPTIANKDVDLYRLFKVVHKMGGFNRVTNQNQWRSIAIRLGFQPVSTSVTNLCKQAYKKNLHSFEEFYRKLGVTLVAHPRGSRQAPAGRSLIRDRDRAPPTPGGPPATPPPPPAAPPVAAAPVAAPTPAAAPVTAPPAPPTPPAARPPIAPDRPPEAPPEEPKPAAKVEKIVTSDEDDSGDSKPLAIARAEKPVKITKPPPDKPEKAASTKLSEKSVPSKPDKTSTPKASDKPSSKSTDKVTTAKSSEKSAVKTEKSTIVKAEKLEKTKASEKTAPLKAEKSTPLKTEKSTPLKSEKSAPLKTEKSTLLKTEKSTSLKTEKSTPLKTEKSTPLKTEKSNTSKTIEKVSNLKSSEKSATPKPEKSGSSKSSERSAPTKVTSEKVAAAKSERTAPPTKAVEKTTAPKQSDKPTPKPERVSQSKSAELPPASAPKPLERSSSTKSLERSNSSKSLDRAPNKAKKPEESLPKKVDKKAKSEPVKEESDNVETRRRSIGKREGKQESSEDSSLAPNAKRRALIKDRRNRSTSAKRSLSEKDKPRTATSSENQDSDSSSRGSRSGSKLGKRMPIIKRKSSKILTGPIKPPVKRKSTETAPDEEEIDLPAPGGTPLTADIGDRLRVYYGPTLDLKVTYEAKVTEVQERDGERMLRVHYTGWNIRYDEWIKATRIAVNLTQYAKSKHKDGSGSKKARASATAYKVMTRNKNASSPPSNPSISGRDFDLNEIRSELKGFEKAVKSPPSIAEDPTVIKLEAEEPEHPEEDVEMRPEDPAPVEMMRENDDIYEFKEPEPFEFEVRKSDEIKKRPQPHILFDDLPPDENTSPRSRDGSSSPEKNDDEDLSDAPKSSEEARDRVTLAMFNESAEEDSGDRLVISEAEDSQEPLFTYQPELFPAEKTYLPTFKGLSGETSAFPKTSEADRKSPSLKEEQSSDEDPINAAIERVNSQSVSDESSDDDDIAKPTNSVVPKLLSPVINEPDGDSQFSNRVEPPEPKPADTTTTEPKSPILAYEESKLEPPPDDAPVAETIEPKSDDEANDSPKEETADRSDSDVDVIIPEPPAGFLLHKESIADKVLKALSDAKNAALAPPPTEEKPPTPSLAETDAISTAIEQIADKSGSPEEAKDPVLETPAPDNPASEEDKSDVVAKPSSPAPEKPAPDSIVPSPADSATESSITTIPNRKPSSGGELSSKNNVLSETILKLSTQINMSTTPALPDSDEDTDDSFDKLIIDRAPSEDSDSPVGSSSENDPAPESQDTVKPDWPSALPGSPSVEREREREREKELGNISLLLCSETIPGSPPGAGGAGGAGAAAAGGEGAAPPARPPRAPRRHMPFASAPCNSPPEERDPQIPNNVPLPVRMARNVANHEQQNDEDRRDENSGRVITTPDSSDGSVADEQVPSDHSSAEDKDEDQMSRSSKKHNQKLDPNKPLSSWRRQKASSEEDLSPSTTGPSGTPAERSESSANVPSAPRRGRRPRRTSEVGEPLPGPSSTLAANASAAPVNPQYNFLLDLGADDLPCAKKIAIITKRMADLSRTFNSFKTELMTIDRRRKKLRRKEREG